jgi:hypothetical protein
MAKDTKKEEKKPVEKKGPETIELNPKTVGYKRGGKTTVYHKGGKDDRRK